MQKAGVIGMGCSALRKGGLTIEYVYIWLLSTSLLWCNEASLFLKSFFGTNRLVLYPFLFSLLIISEIGLLSSKGGLT
jgi:hypothetical protein